MHLARAKRANEALAIPRPDGEGDEKGAALSVPADRDETVLGRRVPGVGSHMRLAPQQRLDLSGMDTPCLRDFARLPTSQSKPAMVLRMIKG